MLRMLRWLGSLYIIVWVLVIIGGILSGALVDKETGKEVISMGFHVLVILPITLAGGGVADALGDGDANSAAFVLGQVLLIGALVVLLYKAVTSKKKPKKKSQPRFVRVADKED